MNESFAVEGERLLALICVLNSEGYFVNNLFQLEGQWQANLTDRKKYWEFGRGTTPTEALCEARKALAGEGLPAITPVVTAERSPKIAKRPSPLATILALDLDL